MWNRVYFTSDSEKISFSSITCLDVSENMIREARAKLAYHASTSFIIADFNDVVFDRSYDVIVSSLAIHHLSDIELK